MKGKTVIERKTFMGIINSNREDKNYFQRIAGKLSNIPKAYA
jgi:hypothetical protein